MKRQTSDLLLARSVDSRSYPMSLATFSAGVVPDTEVPCRADARLADAATGQRRVRRLADAAFDAAMTGDENPFLNDGRRLLSSTLDRFDDQRLGKKEIHARHNSLKLHDRDAAVAVLYGKCPVSPAYRRRERLRIWVVEARSSRSARTAVTVGCRS